MESQDNVKRFSCRRWWFLAIPLAFTALYGWFYASSGSMLSSPDERAVYAFSRAFAEHGSFTVPRVVLDRAVAPRSVTIRGNDFVPTGFLGLFLLVGSVQRLFGTTMASLVIPLLAAIAPLGAFMLWQSVFSKQRSWYAAVLLWVFPAWSYYASRSFLPNVGFLSCILIGLGLAAWVIGRERSRPTLDALWIVSGLLVGLGLIIRPPEVLWVLPVLFVLAWWTKLPWKNSGLFLSGVFPMIALLAYWQQKTYGAWYLSGYQSIGEAGMGGGEQIPLSFWRQFGGALFPFGFHPLMALQTVATDLAYVYWWLLPFLFFGLAALVKKAQKNSAYKKYSLVLLGVFAYLVLYYGSWPISDHPDTNWMTIGVAYNRYWLPWLMLCLPVVVEGVFVIGRRIQCGGKLQSFMTLALLFASFGTSFAFGADSLWAMHVHGVEYSQLRAWVIDQTSVDSVIVANREEKVLWPDREVLFQPDNSFVFAADAARLVVEHPVYWLTALPSSYAADAEQRYLAAQHLRLQAVGMFNGYSLYEIQPLAL